MLEPQPKCWNVALQLLVHKYSKVMRHVWRFRPCPSTALSGRRRSAGRGQQRGSLSVYGRMELSEMEGFVGPGAVEGSMQIPPGIRAYGTRRPLFPEGISWNATLEPEHRTS